MDVKGFLCVSLGSSTVQLHYSLRCTWACSEADFSSQSGDRAWGCTTEEQRSVVRFVGKRLDATRSPCWDCDRSNCAVDGRVDSSWQEDNNSVATALGHSPGLSYRIMHDRLKFQKVGTWWVPRELKAWEKINQMGLSLQHLLQYADEEEDMLNRIVTGDDVGASLPTQIKCPWMQWKYPSSPSSSTKKFKVTPSAGKVMLTVFWDSQEVLLAHS
jgi:hypothetical protein